ncbi:HPr family phosphocarrier protein [Salinarimonas ramus]|uniref:HPr kinase n=1 Tax=Salinarimonas ramus TaxID=690164 RepID=A0A917Q7J3_9HYPH|nr:HPr family phosphocarrier protein [Salinarimonas ramus]GGK32190.1 HPr kinase [Salinarimonas ramus]
MKAVDPVEVDPDDCPEPNGPETVPDGAIARVLPIVNRKGLHARASAKFVQTVERFDAAVTVTRCGETVGGRSIMGLLTLAAAKGTTIHVAATGAQAAEVIDALDALLANRFGEDE